MESPKNVKKPRIEKSFEISDIKAAVSEGSIGKYTIPELKTILHNFNIKPVGNKKDLVSLVVSAVSKNE